MYLLNGEFCVICELWGYSIHNKCKGGTWQSVRDMPTQWQMFVYVCLKAARGNSWSLGLSYLYVLCVLTLVYCVCVYMSMWVIIADQSVYYTRLYTTCWLLSVILGRCDGAGDTTVTEKLGTLLLGHNSSWLVWVVLKRIWQVIQI